MARTTSMPRKQLLAYHRIFGNSATDSVPNGFTRGFYPSRSMPWTVSTEIPTNSDDQKSLKIAITPGNGAQFLWDERNVPGTSDGVFQVDVMTDTVSGGDVNEGKLGIVARASKNGCYAAYMRPNGNILRISKFSNVPTETVVLASAALSPTLAINTWYTIKFSLSGTALKARIWVKGTTEPSTWNIDATDSTYTSGNLVGLFSQSGTIAWNGYFTNLKSVDTVTRNAA